MNKIWMILGAIAAISAGIITFIIKRPADSSTQEVQAQAS